MVLPVLIECRRPAADEPREKLLRRKKEVAGQNKTREQDLDFAWGAKRQFGAPGQGRCLCAANLSRQPSLPCEPAERSCDGTEWS